MSPERLAELAPLRLPPPLGWWPPAPLWWLVAALLILLIVLLAGAAWRRHCTRAYRREATRQLHAAFAHWQQTQDDLAYLREASRLLKATALLAVPRSDVAALHGRAWATWLQQTAPGANVPDTEWAAMLYTEAPAAQPLDITALHAFFLHWIRRHDQRRV